VFFNVLGGKNKVLECWSDEVLDCWGDEVIDHD
jgi:hypothetical protein